MSSAPPGYSTIGPIYAEVSIKQKFIDLCKAENKTMEKKLKEMISVAIRVAYPDFKFPEEPDAKPDA